MIQLLESGTNDDSENLYDIKYRKIQKKLITRKQNLVRFCKQYPGQTE